MNKPVYLGLSVVETSKTLMREFWYHYIKPKYQYNAKLYYMDTDSFIVHIKTKDIHENIMLKKDLIHQFIKPHYQ